MVCWGRHWGKSCFQIFLLKRKSGKSHSDRIKKLYNPIKWRLLSPCSLLSFSLKIHCVAVTGGGNLGGWGVPQQAFWPEPSGPNCKICICWIACRLIEPWYFWKNYRMVDFADYFRGVLFWNLYEIFKVILYLVFEIKRKDKRIWIWFWKQLTSAKTSKGRWP